MAGLAANQEQRATGDAHQCFGNAADDEAFKTAPTVRTDHNQIGPPSFCPVFNQIWNTFFAGFEQYLFGFDAFRCRLSDCLVKELLASRANSGFRFGNINVRNNDPTDG